MLSANLCSVHGCRDDIYIFMMVEAPFWSGSPFFMNEFINMKYD